MGETLTNEERMFLENLQAALVPPTKAEISAACAKMQAGEAVDRDEMRLYCEAHREADRFCALSGACSGPSISNLGVDHPMPEGVAVYRGGNHGSCRFEVVR